MRKCLLISILLALMLILPTSCKAPAESAKFEVMSLDVTPAEVTAGQTVTVIAEIKNSGGSQGVYTAILTIDGAEANRKDIIIVPGATWAVTFPLVKEDAGNYLIAIGERTSTLTVKQKLMVRLGKIVYVSTPDASFEVWLKGTYNGEIYAMNEDGSNQINLTNNRADDVDPAWSPDGTKIVFTSDRDGKLGREIYIMNSDGSGLANITNNTADDWEPAWSSDGTKIVFGSDREQFNQYEIYSMNADGSNPVRLTNNPAYDGLPSWSPDGDTIVFTSSRDNGGIYVMNVDGNNVVKLTGYRLDGLATWSPDGTKIIFQSDRDKPSNVPWYSGNREIYVMNSDGSNQINLTNNPAFDWWPAWSPDGNKIVFSSNRDGNFEIYVMNSDGSNPVPLTDNSVRDTEPAWR